MYIYQYNHRSSTEVLSKHSFSQPQRTEDKAGKLITEARSKRAKEDRTTAEEG